jgi:hypothetical protein
MSYSFPQWATALDLDFTSQPSQTINLDTTYNIGFSPYTNLALVWNKINSTGDAVAMALTNGSGLVIKPAAATNISASTFTAPALRIPLNSIIPDNAWTVFTPFRIWVWITGNNAAANNDQAVFGTFISGSGVANQLTYSQFQGFAGASNGWGSQLIVLNTNTTSTSPSITVPASPNNQVGLMYCSSGVLGGSAPLLIGSTVTPTNTTIALASNGQTVPGTGNIISVASVVGFANSGNINVTTSAGVQLVTYTGINFAANQFTGCSTLNGTGTMSTGGAVSQGVWPTNNSLSFATAAMITDASSAAISSSSSGAITVPSTNLFLSALRNGSGTSLTVTIARIRVDYLPINN